MFNEARLVEGELLPVQLLEPFQGRRQADRASTLGVPASNFSGAGAYDVFSNVTVSIMSPPACQGGIVSRWRSLP